MNEIDVTYAFYGFSQFYEKKYNFNSFDILNSITLRMLMLKRKLLKNKKSI
jgi:hypothetical protein